MTLTYAFDPVIAQWGPLPGAIQAERKVEAGRSTRDQRPLRPMRGMVA